MVTSDRLMRCTMDRLSIVSTDVNRCHARISRDHKVITIDADCCSAARAPMSEDQAVELAGAFKALADPVRLRLLSMIASAPEGTAC